MSQPDEKEPMRCPECGNDELETAHGTTGSGLEWYAHVCPQCEWISEPE